MPIFGNLNRPNPLYRSNGKNSIVKPSSYKKGTVGAELTGGNALLAQALVNKGVPESYLRTTVKPGFVPVGMDPSLFTLDKAHSADAGQSVRRSTLEAFTPQLQKAIAKNNIFAYNAAISNLRTMLARTTGGPRVPNEMPDRLALQRNARMRQQRAPVGSREQTLNLGLGY